MELNFTDKGIEKLLPPKVGERLIVKDARNNLLRLRVTPTNKYFYIEKKVNGKTLKHGLGAYGEIRTERARELATEALGKLAAWKSRGFVGASPLDPPIAAEDVITLKMAKDDYVRLHVPTLKNPARSKSDTEWAFKKYIKSELAERPLPKIEKKDILNLYEHVAEHNGRYSANRLIQLLSAIVQQAIDREEFRGGSNPCRKIILPKSEKQRRFYLEREDCPDFVAALAAYKETDRLLFDVVTIALGSGARRGDILSARFENIHGLDTDTPTWYIPHPKDEDHPYTIQVCKEVADVFLSRGWKPGKKKKGWVFPNPVSASGHFEDIKKPWNTFRKSVDMPQLHLHDLRHAFASSAVQNGVPLQVVGEMLGHSEKSNMTKRYAHLQPGNIRAGVNIATNAIFSASAEPTPKPARGLPAKK